MISCINNAKIKYPNNLKYDYAKNRYKLYRYTDDAGFQEINKYEQLFQNFYL